MNDKPKGPKPPERENFETDEEYEEAKGFYGSRWGKLQKLAGVVKKKPVETAEPDELSIIFFSIILHASAVERLYPGGKKQFLETYGGTQTNSESGLILISCMNSNDCETILVAIDDLGFVTGTDYAIAEQYREPNEPCVGMIFSPPPHAEPFAPWTVRKATH